ncbi:hypothetical protein K402DRAFT_459904 [Aulographum hederae CBS 113979]|uniref:Uncharacterized protein n=1 Tax=Aulographum hederae CBS 113979 TaxID=1176131 RepID=A0A6G1HDN3_9PEZI|nr:hypothetical protein K402DRAFT_459904 [Aulographum hederae CBS 113979]
MFRANMLLLLLFILGIPNAWALLATPDNSSLGLLETVPLSTPPPELKRSLGPEAIGSTSISDYSYPTVWTCPTGSTWTTLLPYARCATTALVQVPMFIGCTNTSIRVGPFEDSPCTGEGAHTTCVTGFVMYDDNVTFTNYDCWPTWTSGNWTADHYDHGYGTNLIKIVVPAVVVPVVLLIVGFSLLARRLHRKRKLKLATIEGRPGSADEEEHEAEKPAEIQMQEKPANAEPKELEEQRKASEVGNHFLGRRGSNFFRFSSTATTTVQDGLTIGPSGERGPDDDGASDSSRSFRSVQSRIHPVELDANPEGSNEPTDFRQRNLAHGWMSFLFRRWFR